MQNTMASDFWNTFNNVKANLAITNPSYTDEELYVNTLYAAIFQETRSFFTANSTIQPIYTTKNYDPTYYSPFNFATQAWLPKNNVLLTNFFIPWKDGMNCIVNCQNMLNQMGYDFSSWQAVASNGMKQSFNTCYKGVDNKAYPDDNETLMAINYLVTKIQQGIPVLAGVDYKPGSANPDGLTDHWILISGMGSDSEGPFFTYIESGSKTVDGGYNTTINRIRYISGEGLVKSYNHNEKIIQIRRTKQL